MSCPIITIAREYGSGGRIVAQRVAERLGIPFYDKSLIAMASAQTGLSEDYIREFEQKKTNSFLYNLYMSTQTLPVADQVFIAQSNVIRKVADEGPCVIVGRCADYVLREHTNCMNIFIHAPLDVRVKRAKEEYQVAVPDVKSHVLKEDKNRAGYYDHFSDDQWGKCQNYDLAINSAQGLDTVVQLILALVAEWRTNV